MSRYAREFVGIPARSTPPEGRDPNYRDGYRGMRSRGGGGRAAYGAQRFLSHHDLETMGGFDGLYDGPGTPFAWEDEGGFVRGGGVRDSYRDPRTLRHFNSHSPSLDEPLRGRPTHGPYDLELRRDRERDWMPDRSYRAGYTNRGVPPAGFSEGWARGSMRGSR